MTTCLRSRHHRYLACPPSAKRDRMHPTIWIAKGVVGIHHEAQQALCPGILVAVAKRMTRQVVAYLVGSDRVCPLAETVMRPHRIGHRPACRRALAAQCHGAVLPDEMNRRKVGAVS